MRRLERNAMRLAAVLTLVAALSADSSPPLQAAEYALESRGDAVAVPNPDRPAPLPGGKPPDFRKYRTPIDARVTDRTFRTRDAMYLASEMQIGSFWFFEQALTSGMIQMDPDFQYMTTVESYWYSRYNMSALVTESRLGLHTVFSPYVSDWALAEGRANDNRDRAEYVRSNRSVLLQEIVPKYMYRSGFPRRFEDASPCMLQFASGAPDYERPLDKGTGFESTENRIRDEGLRQIYGDSLPARPGGMGADGNDMWKYRVNYREDFLSLRWRHDDMEPVIDLGAEGQTLMKLVLWMEYFFKGSHHGGKFLGNDPEEGFRGSMLTLMAVSKMLMLKSSLLCDGKALRGVDPRSFEAGKLYFPHRVGVRLRFAGDLPPRPEEFELEDPASELFDQASLLWGLSEYYHFSDPTNGNPNWNKVFGENTRFDSSVMERKYGVLARALAEMVTANIEAMHRRPDGGLISRWLPDEGPGGRVSTVDVGMTMVALANGARRLDGVSSSAERARQMLREQADFLVDRLQARDGSFPAGYDHGSQQADAAPATLEAQGFAIRGLLQAHELLGDARYLDGARRAYDFMNRELWQDELGLYSSTLGEATIVYTPSNLGAVLSALREMAVLTRDASEIERFKRFWVQAVDSSGIQQSEYEETGERDFFAPDGDRDGIPRMEYAPGAHGHGIAPVFASRVEIRPRRSSEEPPHGGRSEPAAGSPSVATATVR